LDSTIDRLQADRHNPAIAYDHERYEVRLREAGCTVA
jgi:hypothetical protein